MQLFGVLIVSVALLVVDVVYTEYSTVTRGREQAGDEAGLTTVLSPVQRFGFAACLLMAFWKWRLVFYPGLSRELPMVMAHDPHEILDVAWFPQPTVATVLPHTCRCRAQLLAIGMHFAVLTCEAILCKMAR